MQEDTLILKVSDEIAKDETFWYVSIGSTFQMRICLPPKTPDFWKNQLSSLLDSTISDYRIQAILYFAGDEEPHRSKVLLLSVLLLCSSISPPYQLQLENSTNPSGRL